MSKITAIEADDQVTLDGSFRAKHDGTKVNKRDLFGQTYQEEIEIDTQFPWAKDYEEDDPEY